jgi:hypothetical protein
VEFLKTVANEGPTHDAPLRLPPGVLDRAHGPEGSSAPYILWGFFTFASVAAAIAVCFTPGADKRFTMAMSTPASSIQSRALSARLEHLPQLGGPDEELVSRLQALEDQIGTLTGSIPQASPEKKAEPAQIPAHTGITPANADPKPVRTTSVTTEEDSDSAPTHTTFGVDLGSETSFGGLRTRWDNLRKQYPELARLSPRISARDKNGKLELRLIAGPFENAADAAKACAGLLTKGTLCDGGLFEGQRLPAS